MKLVIAATAVVALIGMTSSSATPGVRLGTMAAPAPAAVAQPIPQPSAAPPTAQRFASGVTTSLPSAPAAKPAALVPAPKSAAAPPHPVDPSSPEAVGAAQLWRARGLGAIDTLKQVVEEMAKSVRKADVANVRNDCRLVSDIGNAISQSLPAPDKRIDTQFRQAAGSIKAGALKCQSWGKGLSKRQTDAFLTDMKNAVNEIKATKDLLAPR